MISALSSPLQVKEIIEMSHDVLGAPVEVLEKKILQGMSHEQSRILVDIGKNDDMRGFIFATIEELDGENAVFIHLCVVKKQEKRLGRSLLSHELLSRIEAWAKELGMKNMYFMTKRNPEVWERAFKFKMDYFLLKRSVR